MIMIQGTNKEESRNKFINRYYQEFGLPTMVMLLLTKCSNKSNMPQLKVLLILVKEIRNINFNRNYPKLKISLEMNRLVLTSILLM